MAKDEPIKFRGGIGRVVAPTGGSTAVFLTLNGQNLVAITLINAKLCVNIVVGSALSLVTQRKRLQCTQRGRYSNALHFHFLAKVCAL